MLTASDFVPAKYDLQTVDTGCVAWKCPSNIALVKYWGKRDPQLPENPSLSFTLDACATATKLSFSKRACPSESVSFKIFFEGLEQASFRPKIAHFFKRISAYAPYLNHFDLRIDSRNSFPHSSGIASSASGLGALALCVMSLERLLGEELMAEDYFYQKASFLARLGSGSACRSIRGSVVVWGADPQIAGSSDLFGSPFPHRLHDCFKHFHDTILLVDKGQKQVSSTVGHQLMHGHPFASARFSQARAHLTALSQALKTGDLKAFIQLVESEALSLHAMMMTSDPSFILMKANTLQIIHKIRAFREATGTHVCFTLDAGANVHVLFPAAEKEIVTPFITNELIAHCQQNHYICDRLGMGAVPLSDTQMLAAGIGQGEDPAD
ncbi:MAG: diphosphomevalonate decarboxylase [Lutibacter sp.]|nr:diphosphomevalonate decarboxylase [Lutibacter sp.]